MRGRARSLLLLAALAAALPGGAAGQEAAPAPTLAPAPLRQIEGRVRQRGQRRSALKARITPVGPDHRPLAPVMTGPDGRFTVEIPDAPGFALTVSAPTFEPALVPLPEGPLAPLDIPLEPLLPDAIVVTQDGLEREHVAATTLPRQMVEQTPGTYNDAVRLVQSLPGVVQTQEYSPRSGFVAVRGAGPGDNRFFLDGIDIPYLFHFQQYSSVVPSTLLEELTLYPSTFRPTYGNAIGAVIDAKTRDYAPEDVTGNINVNLIMAGGSVEAPVGERGALSVGGRRSYLDRASSGSDEYVVWPIFWDYHARYDHRREDGRRIGAFAYGASDQYRRYDLGRAEADPVADPNRAEISVRQGFQAFGIRDTSSQSQAYRSQSLVAGVLSVEEATSSTGGRDGIDHRYLYLRHDGAVALGDTLSLSTGGEVKASRYRYEGDPRGGELAWPEPVLPTPTETLAEASLSRIYAGIYGELGWEGPGGLSVKPGVRLDGDTLTGQVTADPRLTVTYGLKESLGLRGAVGIYHQIPDALLYARALEQGQPAGPARAIQGALGVETTISGRLRGQVQGYGKRLDGLLDAATPGSESETVIGDVSGWAYGAEVLLRYHLQDRAFAWLSYAISRGLREDPATGEVYRYDFDQPHAISGVISFTPTLKWSYGLRYRLASGMPFTPVEAALFNAETQAYMPLPGERNSARLPLYQKIDGMIERRVTFDRFSLALYAEFWFVVPQGNVLYPLYSFDYQAVQYVGGPVFVPLVGLRGKI